MIKTCDQNVTACRELLKPVQRRTSSNAGCIGGREKSHLSLHFAMQ